MRSGEAFVAVESFRPHWDRLIRARRISSENHAAAARAMRITRDQRQTLSLKICDQVLVDAGEPHVLQLLYLVDRDGVPLSRSRLPAPKPRKPRRKKQVQDLLGAYKPKGKPRGVQDGGAGARRALAQARQQGVAFSR